MFTCICFQQGHGYENGNKGSVSTKKKQGEKDLISLIYLIQHFPQAVIVVSHHLEGNYKISLSNVYKYFFFNRGRRKRK